MMSKGETIPEDAAGEKKRSIGIAFSKAKSIEHGAKLSKFSPAAASDQYLRSDKGAKQGGVFHPVCFDSTGETLDMI